MVGFPNNWVPLEFLIFRFVCPEPPTILELQFMFSQLGTVLVGVSAYESTLVKLDSLYLPISPILRAGLCPVSMSFLWIPKDLLIFQFVHFFTCQDVAKKKQTYNTIKLDTNMKISDEKYLYPFAKKNCLPDFTRMLCIMFYKIVL